MNLEIKKEELCINRIVGEKRETFTVDGDVIVPDVKPDVLNIINQSGNICVYKQEVLDGKVRIEGGVTVYIMYYPDSANDSVRALHTTVEFSKVVDIENIQSTMDLEEQIEIKEMECKILNGRKLNISCDLEMVIKVFSNENINIIKNIENEKNIQTLVSKLNINSLVGRGEVKVFGKENIKIDKGDNIAEILNASVNIGNKDVKISYNKVITKAEAEVRVLYLTEDNRMNLVETQIPLMGFVDIQNVSDDNMCETNYRLKNIELKPNPEDEHSIYAELEADVACKVYGNNTVELLQDLYSRRNTLTYSKKSVKAISSKKQMQDVCSIREKISIPELSSAEIYDAVVTPMVKSRDVLSEKIIYQGSLNIKFIYSQSNSSRNANEVGMQEYELPFDFSMDCKDVDKTYEIEENINVPLHDFVILQEGTIETKIDLMFNVTISKNETINVLENINEEEDNDANNYSMTIYFVKPGDTLWEIAKKFKSTVNDIVQVNEIENENKIQVGQQLFLPR